MKTVLIILIDIYRMIFSPILVTVLGHSCRYSPTCSEYAKIAIEKYGAIKGVHLSLKRLGSCHPFSNKHTYDPVPQI